MVAFSKLTGVAIASLFLFNGSEVNALRKPNFRKFTIDSDVSFVQSQSTVGMTCEDGTVLDGSTGPERTMTVEMICKLFPKHPWQYPILGYKNKHKGVQFPYQCERQLGGYVYANASVPACPHTSPEAIHERCLKSAVPLEIIRDMACVVRKDPTKLGRFLNNKNETRNKFELASFFAHLGQETADFRTMWEADGNAGQYCSYFYPGDDKYCSHALFFGRGVHQLTHPSNYADFSAYWFKDKTVLLNNPEKLIDSMETSWASAIWFWMEPRQHHNGDPHCARWTLMHEALFNELGFGQTISAINGGLECSGSNQVGPWQRLGRLIYFLDVMKIPMEFFEDGQVKAIPKWFTEGCSYIETYKLKVRRSSWKELEGGGECKGFNQPYLCGWGGLTTGPKDVPNPLIAFNTGGGAQPGPTCVENVEPAGGRNVWPHDIVKDQGYHQVGGGVPPTPPIAPEPEPEPVPPPTTTSTKAPVEPEPEPEPVPTTTSTKKPVEPEPEPEPVPTTTSTKEPVEPEPEPEPVPTTTSTKAPVEPEPETPPPTVGSCSGCHVSQLTNYKWYSCNPTGAKTFCTAPWDEDGDDECCTKEDFETFANTQGCTCEPQ